ncbi:hypothetical protein K438DRAFT_1993109 [Mycena galopus ATCC 62051]|nr:hypothetical protein K438DRAFT_1993109 [Mycena galopus ATCC 62051]
MPASVPVKRGVRRKGDKVDNTSGLGYRPYQHVFDKHEYRAYTTQCDVRLLHTPRRRIALQYSGAVARLARSEISDNDFFHGLDNDIYDVGDCLWDETSRHAYWYNYLTPHEIDLLCGGYHVGTGQKRAGGEDTDQASIVSWWPKPAAWARRGLDRAWWTPQCENNFFTKRLGHFEKGVYKVQRSSEWKHNLKFRKDAERCWNSYEVIADSIVQALIAVIKDLCEAELASAPPPLS